MRKSSDIRSKRSIEISIQKVLSDDCESHPIVLVRLCDCIAIKVRNRMLLCVCGVDLGLGSVVSDE